MGRAAGRRGAASVDVVCRPQLVRGAGGPGAERGHSPAPRGEVPGSASCPSPGSWFEMLRPAPDAPLRPWVTPSTRRSDRWGLRWASGPAAPRDCVARVVASFTVFSAGSE